jgi:hypothetical protein
VVAAVVVVTTALVVMMVVVVVVVADVVADLLVGLHACLLSFEFLSSRHYFNFSSASFLPVPVPVRVPFE